jgi:protein-disulfide isomerase
MVTARRSLPFVIIAAAFCVAATGGTLFYISERKAMMQAAPAPSGKPGAEPPHVRGSARAPVHIEEFGDYECPPCAMMAPVLKRIEESYGPRVRVTFRQYPLAMHKHAMAAARAAEAAGLQDRFWQMHDLLYQNSAIWSKAADVQPLFEKYAQTAGVNVERFRTDLTDAKVTARVAADQQRATSLGVDRTPAILINNRRLPVTSFPEPEFRKEIDALLAPKK